jgi:photoactive yellow protein
MERDEMQATISNPTDVLLSADQLDGAALDRLPVGMIQLDLAGRVLRYNQTEAEIAQMRKDDQIGRHFFDEVAPCTKVKEFHGEFVRGVAERKLHVRFPYEFKFKDGRRKDVMISMFYSDATDSVWVLVDRP